MISLCIFVILFTCREQFFISAAATYDQRQEGDINVQVDLKDIQIIAVVDSDLLDDYLNYDYSYDYSDFTIKPTAKPTTSTTSATSTTSDASSSMSTMSSSSSSARTSPTPSLNVTDSTTKKSLFDIPIEEFLFKMKNESATSTSKNQTIDSNSTIVETKKIAEENDSVATLRGSDTIIEPLSNANAEKRQVRKCPLGFLSSKTGRCRRRKISLLPFAMRLAPKLTGSAKTVTTL